MTNDIVKMAASFALLAVVTASALQSRLAQNTAAARAMAAHHQAASTPVTVAAASEQPRSHGWGEVEIDPDSLSQYKTRAEINGVDVNTLVDTGASYVALTAEDAEALDIQPPRSAYTAIGQTANGKARFAPVHLRQVRIGDITVYQVDALVAQPGKLKTSLLGMSFLKKLSSFQVADGRFVMKQ